MKKILILIFCSGLSVACLAQNVVQGEYFIDTDLGVSNNIQVTFTPSPDNSFPFTIDLSSYTPGYHKLYIRTKDSNGNWSFTSRRNIEVLASEAKTTIVSGEYFIDTDPGFGMALPITITTPDSIILQNFSAVASTLSEGYHKLYGRFEDNLGRWSITFRRNMEVYRNENNKVLNGEYFFRTDNGFGDCTPVAFAVPSADGSFVINIPLNTIPVGADTLFVRVRDDIESRWSITQMLKNISVALPLTLLNFTAVKQGNTAQLKWQTTNEVNTAYFNIQRSTDAVNFTKIGVVKANNINGINNYFYEDNIEGQPSEKLYYRLQEIDIDAKAQYSEIVAIKIDNLKTGISIYPNPSRNYINIVSNKPQDLEGAVITIVDMAGKVTLKQVLLANGQQRVNISALSPGIYIVHILKTNGVETQKLLKE